MKQVILFFLIIVITSCASLDQDKNSFHDAHVHYSQNVWKVLPPAVALQLLKNVNISRALVSATPTEGAELLYNTDPTFVIPMLRPYKSLKHRYLWFNDANLKTYLLEHLNRVPYKGFGEFHVFGKDANSKPIEDMIQLAQERNMVLHAHTDLDGMGIILKKAPNIVVIWAHSGFNVSIAILQDLLVKYPKLYLELSFREGLLDDEQQLTSQWKQFLIQYRTRFLIGMDTYKLSRWLDLSELAAVETNWLNQLPNDVANDIKRHNLDRLFPH